MLVGLLTFEKFHRKKLDSIGGSRIRMNTLLRYWDSAELFKYGRKYDVVIYQKVYWTDHPKSFKGIKIFDLCDPDYLHWGHMVVEMISYCDAVTVATPELAEDVAHFTDKPIWVIPDRLDLNAYPYKKEHSGRAKVIGWYGYSQNYAVINESGIIKALVDLNAKEGGDMEFVVISDNIYMPPVFAKDKLKVTNYKWTVNTVDKDIQTCDIIVNPKLNSGAWRYKSNNKTIHSWALGVPVATNLKELTRLMDAENRIEEIKIRQQELVANYDIRASVKEYMMLIETITQSKR